MSSLEIREASKKARNYNEASDEDLENLIESDNGQMSTDDSTEVSEQSSNCDSSVEDEVEDDKKKK